VEATVKAADPMTAAAAERRAAEPQIPTPIRPDEHGMRGFYIRAPSATVAVCDAALERVDPYGATYLVDTTGTCALRAAA
jgi:hypothetical protein